MGEYLPLNYILSCRLSYNFIISIRCLIHTLLEFYAAYNHSMSDMYDSLPAVDDTKLNWRIRVRVTRMWPSISIDGSHFIGMNMLFIDVEVSVRSKV